MRTPLAPPVIRVRVTPDDPQRLAERPRGSRRPHGDAQVAAVRALIEQTTLSYGAIATKTGVGRASICRWTRDQNWQRPVFAPRATDTVPRARASARLKRRMLAARLDALAERYVRDLEADPGVDLDTLIQALELAKMAKLAAMGRRRRRRFEGVSETGAQWISRQEAVRQALRDLRRGGVNLDRAPAVAVSDYVDSHLPVEDHGALRPRGGTSRRKREHR